MLLCETDSCRAGARVALCGHVFFAGAIGRVSCRAYHRRALHRALQLRHGSATPHGSASETIVFA